MTDNSLRPKMVFILDENEFDVNTVKNRLKKENKRFYVVRPIDYFVNNDKYAL